MTSPPRARSLLALAGTALVVAFVLRLAAGFAVNVDRGVHRGFDFYGFMAGHVLDGRGLVWAFYDGFGDKYANRAPLYPLVVAGARALFGRDSPYPAVAVQAVIGALACLVPAALARRWGGDRAAVVAAWTAALWPSWVAMDTALVEQVVFAPLAGLAVLEACRASAAGAARAAWAGALAGAATLARLTFAPAAAALAAALALRRGGPLRAAAFAAAAALVLLPWLLRNDAVVGAPVLGTDSGRALWVGNADATFRHYPAASIDDAERELVARMAPAEGVRLRAMNADEVAQDRAFRDLALASIAARPLETAAGALRKCAALWSPVLNPGPAHWTKRTLFGAAFVLTFSAAAAAFVRLPRLAADLPAVLAAGIAFTATAAIFWGQTRYLAPLHGVAIAAAAAWAASRTGPAAETA